MRCGAVTSLLVTTLAILALWASSVQADYLGTENVRIFPGEFSDIADGYDNGDEIQLILEVTPSLDDSIEGNAAWSTFYVPPGAEVIAASYIAVVGGDYVPASADDVDSTYNGFGSRGAAGFGAGFEEGFVNEVQQDTGIFFSTDTRTEQNFNLADITATGVDTTTPFNLWDRQQTEAFGVGSADSGNGGRGNTPLVDINGTLFGTGSPVAGPDAYYTNDYNPANFGNEYVSVGPWQRIETLGDKIGGSGAVVAAGAQGSITNTAVDATGGFDLSSSTPLPSTTNAVRIVHGARRIGDIERWSVTLRLTDAAAFLVALNAGEVCGDSIPADTTPAKDNNWRYYEVSRNCLDLTADAILVKEIIDPDNASAVQDNQIITYQFTFTNISDVAINNVVATDEEITSLDLLDEGVSGCPANYDGVITPGAGTVGFNNLTGGVATWDPIASLAAGASVTYTVCGQANGAFQQLNSLVVNEARIQYDGCGSTPCLTSRATVPITNYISGTVYQDLDASGNLTAGETGIPGVLIELFADNDGNGRLDPGDTLVSATVTGSTGFYEFSAIPDGNYIIVETQPTGFTSTGDADTLNCGATINNQNNGCDTIGGGAIGDPNQTLAVNANTNLTEQDFFEQIDAPNLVIVKTDSPDPVMQGDNLTYTLAVTNIGIVTATGVVVNDSLPSGLTWVSTENSITSGPNICTADAVLDCDCTVPDGTVPGGLVCELGNIAPNDSETIVITVTVD